MLKGLSAFPITPTDQFGRVDTHAFGPLVTRLAEAGVDSIGVLGSTGSYMYLTRAERHRALGCAVDAAGGRVPIIAGIGALKTSEAIALAQDAKALGAQAGLLSAASYTPLTDEEVYRHFATVTQESGLPIVIYDNPGTTHFAFTSELVARLSDLPGVVGIKNPTATPEQNVGHLAHQRSIVPLEGAALGQATDTFLSLPPDLRQ